MDYGVSMNERTIFLLIFLVSSALLIYVEYSGIENDKYNPECKTSSTHPRCQKIVLSRLRKGLSLEIEQMQAPSGTQ